jgi:hypothetical protein
MFILLITQWRQKKENINVKFLLHPQFIIIIIIVCYYYYIFLEELIREPRELQSFLQNGVAHRKPQNPLAYYCVFVYI